MRFRLLWRNGQRMYVRKSTYEGYALHTLNSVVS